MVLVVQWHNIVWNRDGQNLQLKESERFFLNILDIVELRIVKW